MAFRNDYGVIMLQRMTIFIGALSILLSSCASLLPAGVAQSTTVPVVAMSPTAAVVAVADTAVVERWQQATGFDPARDGFSFANYGDRADISNLTPADMQRLFGDAVCQTFVNDTCALIAAAEVWMQEINRAMQSGHCEGMAVLSQYMYYGIIAPTVFGGAVAADLNLANNPALQREIAFWWATQATYPTRAHRTVAAPIDIVAQLRSSLQADADVQQLYTIGMYQPDFSAGHTVTPIGIRELDAEYVAIDIYDNNIPGEIQQILVHVPSNTWQYAAPNINGQLQNYVGDATTRNLELTAAAPRLEQQLCHFCPDYTTADVIEEVTTFFFSSTAPAIEALSSQFSAYFVDTMGRRVGVIKGLVFNEIPGAQLSFLRGADSQWSPLGMPMLAIPDGVEGMVRLTGAEEVPINLSAFGAGSVVALQNMRLKTDQISEIKVDQQAGTVVVASAANATPDIVVGYSTGSKNITLTVQRVQLQEGSKVAVQADQQADSLAVAASQAQTVAVVTARNDARGAQSEETSLTTENPGASAPLDEVLNDVDVADGNVDVRPEDEEQRQQRAVQATQRAELALTQQAQPAPTRRPSVVPSVAPRTPPLQGNSGTAGNRDATKTLVASPGRKPTNTAQPARSDDDEGEDDQKPGKPATATAAGVIQPTATVVANAKPSPTRQPDVIATKPADSDDDVNTPKPSPPASATKVNDGGRVETPRPTKVEGDDDKDKTPRPTKVEGDDDKGKTPRPTKVKDDDKGKTPRPTKVKGDKDAP